jgi:hypothetical protein
VHGTGAECSDRAKALIEWRPDAGSVGGLSTPNTRSGQAGPRTTT